LIELEVSYQGTGKAFVLDYTTSLVHTWYCSISLLYFQAECITLFCFVFADVSVHEKSNFLTIRSKICIVL